MKKFLTIIAFGALVLSLSACGCEPTASDEPTPATEEVYVTEEEKIIPDIVEKGSETEIAVMNAVGEYLDNFIRCDFDSIKASLHQEDAWLFNFESDDQMLFYEAIFPLVEYEFDYVAEHEGVYGVMTRMTSPNMADVYGTILTEYLDSSMVNDSDSLRNIVANNTERMIELITSGDIAQRDELLFIYVEYIDGQYIPRCDMYLANELTGGAPEASGEITSTISDTLASLSE